MKYFPILDIVPLPEETGFDVYVRLDERNKVLYLAKVRSVNMDFIGGKPDWTMEHPREKTQKDEPVLKFPERFNKRQMIEIACAHFVDKEFTTADVYNLIKSEHPNYKITVGDVAQNIRTFKSYKRTRIHGPQHTRFWKNVRPEQ